MQTGATSILSGWRRSALGFNFVVEAKRRETLK
jgi:hypothetical protein